MIVYCQRYTELFNQFDGIIWLSTQKVYEWAKSSVLLARVAQTELWHCCPCSTRVTGDLCPLVICHIDNLDYASHTNFLLLLSKDPYFRQLLP